MPIRRWDKSKPPTGPFALNRDCPQAVGLVCWYPQGGPSGKNNSFDFANKYHLTGTNSAATLGDAGQPALTFASASSHTISNSGNPFSTFPLTIAGWARPVATLSSGTVAGLASSSGASGYGRKLLYFHSDGTVRIYSQNAAGGSVNISATGSYTAGEWTHGTAVFAATADYRVFRNGTNKNTSTSSVTYGTPTRVHIGDDNTGGNYFNGDVGEVGFWNVALADDLVWRLYDPGTRFELWYPLRSRKWMWMPLGGAAWTVSITDLASATDGYTHDVTVQASISDLASATDGLVPSLVSVVSLLDSASASDVLTASAVVQASISDLASATDTASATFSAAGVATISDLASATDTYTAAAVVLRALIDAASGTDTYSAATTMVRTLIDPAAATDSYTASAPGAWTVTLTELAAAVDVIAAAYSGTDIHSAPPLLQRLQASARAARVSATRAARTQSSTR